jgi:hypothetical protein
VNLTGMWQSTYEYPSSSRGDTFTGTHGVTVEHEGDRVVVLSSADEASVLTMDLHVNGNVITGTWAETTDPNGYYGGRRFKGTIMLVATDGRMTGKWLGVGGDEEVNSGVWTLERKTDTKA